jgi:hypothetical protein
MRVEYLGGTFPGAHSIHLSHMKHARYVPSAKTLGGQTSHVDRPWRNESGKKHPVTKKTTITFSLSNRVDRTQY